MVREDVTPAELLIVSVPGVVKIPVVPVMVCATVPVKFSAPLLVNVPD